MGSNQSLGQPAHLITVETDRLDQVVLSSDGALCATRTVLGGLCCRRVSDGLTVLNKMHERVGAIVFWRDNLVYLRETASVYSELIIHCLAEANNLETRVDVQINVVGSAAALFVAKDILIVSSTWSMMIIDLRSRKLLSVCKNIPSPRVAISAEATVLALSAAPYHAPSVLQDDRRVGLWKVCTESGIQPDTPRRFQQNPRSYAHLDGLPTPHQMIPFAGRVEAFAFNSDGSFLAVIYRRSMLPEFAICLISIAASAKSVCKAYELRLSRSCAHRSFDDDDSTDADNISLEFSCSAQKGSSQRLTVSATGHGIQVFALLCHRARTTLKRIGYLTALGAPAKMAMNGGTYAKHELAQRPLAHSDQTIHLLTFWSTEASQSTCHAFTSEQETLLGTPASLSKVVVQVGDPVSLDGVRRYPLTTFLAENTYVAEHRFSDFLGLHQALQLLKPSPAPAAQFPYSCVILPTAHAIESRRRHLQQYMDAVCQRVTYICPELPPMLGHFLGVPPQPPPEPHWLSPSLPLPPS